MGVVLWEGLVKPMLVAGSTPLFAATLAFRGWFPAWLATVMGVAAVAAVVLVYLRESGRLPTWRRLLLAGLRAVTLSSILLLLLKPTLLWETREDRPRAVAAG